MGQTGDYTLLNLQLLYMMVKQAVTTLRHHEATGSSRIRLGGNIWSHPVAVLYIDFPESRCCRYRLNRVLGKSLPSLQLPKVPIHWFPRHVRFHLCVVDRQPIIIQSSPRLIQAFSGGLTSGHLAATPAMTKRCDEMQDLCQTLSCNSLPTFIK